MRNHPAIIVPFHRHEDGILISNATFVFDFEVALDERPSSDTFIQMALIPTRGHCGVLRTEQYP